MPDGRSITTHPHFYRGTPVRRRAFVRVLEDVVQDIVPRWRGKGKRPQVKPKHVVLANRGFPFRVREVITKGQQAIKEADVQQLLVDYYTAYPRRVRDNHVDYRRLQALINGR